MLVSGATALEKELLACRIVFWLRENYRLGRSGSLAKEEVYGDYLNSLEPNKTDPVIVPTYFGKLVKKAFPSVRCNRKGPRGKAKQHYTHLQRVDHQREAERQRFNSFIEQAGPSATAPTVPTATTSSCPGGPNQAPFQSYISCELSYLNYLLKKADSAGRSGSGDNDGWALSKPETSSALNASSEGRTDSPTAAGMPPAMTKVVSLGEADERDWDWVFVHNKPQSKKKQSPSAARKNVVHKRDHDAGGNEEAEGAEAKRRRSDADDANGAKRREPSNSSREGHNRSGVWRSEVEGEHLHPQNFFTQFHHRTPSPSSSPSTSPSPSPSPSPSSLPSSAIIAHQSLLPRRHSSVVVVSPADIRDGETQSPPCPTANGNDQPRQSGQYLGLPFNTSSSFTCSSFSSSSFSSLSSPQSLSTTSSFACPSTSSLPPPPSLSTCSPESSSSGCTAPEFFTSWHSLSSSSPALQSSLPSASYHSQLLSDIEPCDYNQRQRQQHRSQQEQSYHQQHGGEASYYNQSRVRSNYPALPQARSSAPMSYHRAGTYLDPQPSHTNPVLQQSRALCGDEADRGFAPLKFGGAGTPGHDHHHLPSAYPTRTPSGYNPHSAFSHFSS